jgi:hypothetical protein
MHINNYSLEYGLFSPLDPNEIEIQLVLYLKLFVILYADDTVLMAESSADLQNQLNSFQDYCSV